MWSRIRPCLHHDAKHKCSLVRRSKWMKGREHRLSFPACCHNDYDVTIVTRPSRSISTMEAVPPGNLRDLHNQARQRNDGDQWSFNQRSSIFCPSDSDSDSEDPPKKGQTNPSTDVELLKELDISTRDESGTVYKPNPFSIAKINAACRGKKSPAPSRNQGQAPCIKPGKTAPAPPKKTQGYDIIGAFAKQARKPAQTKSMPINHVQPQAMLSAPASISASSAVSSTLASFCSTTVPQISAVSLKNASNVRFATPQATKSPLFKNEYEEFGEIPIPATDSTHISGLYTPEKTDFVPTYIPHSEPFSSPPALDTRNPMLNASYSASSKSSFPSSSRDVAFSSPIKPSPSQLYPFQPRDTVSYRGISRPAPQGLPFSQRLPGWCQNSPMQVQMATTSHSTSKPTNDEDGSWLSFAFFVFMS
ncbi:hypothetical protein BDN72DRAFT_209505 [Pluteus cervinus]|uniref:Uncharacterized protein n=1 Tax=Pluteus cervinus TaxID=181527 RepID=A0ACD3AI66_9AGAR|nr:hypothetical protein BDN72DRAFT_209505 [Pluteus cervinus]